MACRPLSSRKRPGGCSRLKGNDIRKAGSGLIFTFGIVADLDPYHKVLHPLVVIIGLVLYLQE
jgi:hypothetical protein